MSDFRLFVHSLWLACCRGLQAPFRVRYGGGWGVMRRIPASVSVASRLNLSHSLDVRVRNCTRKWEFGLQKYSAFAHTNSEPGTLPLYPVKGLRPIINNMHALRLFLVSLLCGCRFHAHTLKLYRAICSHGNHHAAHEMTYYIDERQLMFCIKSKCTSLFLSLSSSLLLSL